jgi:hypothetical protein
MASYFLNSVAQNEVVFNTRLFLAFIGLTDYNKFTDMKKNFDRVVQPAKLQSIPTKTGTVEL